MFRRTAVLFLAIFVLSCACALAHPGGLDKNGGHKDKKNTSGLGEYHYHCGKTPAHLHENNVCPFTLETVEELLDSMKKAKAAKIETAQTTETSLSSAPQSKTDDSPQYVEETESKESITHIIAALIVAIPLTMLVYYLQKKSERSD